MLLTIEKMIILKSIKLFSEVSQNDLLSLATHVNEIEYTRGDMIIKEGDLGTSMYIIVNGEVDVIVGEKKVTTLGEKELFGELAALDPEPRSATIVANTDILLFKINSNVIYDLISTYQNVARSIIGILCKRLREK
jgi:CRP/FNR family transcriptional regulator, cyclic AMP receptor protein